MGKRTGRKIREAAADRNPFQKTLYQSHILKLEYVY